MMIHKKVEDISLTLSLSIYSTFLLMIDHSWNEDRIYQSFSEDPLFLNEYQKNFVKNFECKKEKHHKRNVQAEESKIVNKK